MKLKIAKLSPEVPTPIYATNGSAAFDLAAFGVDFAIEPGQRHAVRTGLRFEIPPGYEGQIRPRSGLAAKHGISVLNSPATIDSDFRGELLVVLINHGHETFVGRAGDRIAQFVLSRVEIAEFEEVDELGSTERGSRGFGSTG